MADSEDDTTEVTLDPPTERVLSSGRQADRIGLIEAPPETSAAHMNDHTRRDLAIRLFWLFLGTVAIGPSLILLTMPFYLFGDRSLPLPSLIEKFTLLATSLIGTVAGVFGSVMGFYFGREQGNTKSGK
jgi:hypothetical protein